GYLQRGPEAELVRPGQEQDLAHQPVREGEGGDADPARVVAGQVGLEVDHLVAGGHGHRFGPGLAAVAGGGDHDVARRRAGLVGGRRPGWGGGVGGVGGRAGGGEGARRVAPVGQDAGGGRRWLLAVAAGGDRRAVPGGGEADHG